METAEAVTKIRGIIGDPFDLCEVPAGEFPYGEDKQKLTLPAFAMAKYPITYSQFEVFMKDIDGFSDRRWWDGLAADSDNRKPCEQEWKIANHPRENVNWYAAMAFSRWLTWKLGGGYAIDNIGEWLVRLPTEFEWEKAARGTDGREYPWGNEFDKTKCNTWELGNGQTTPVTKYERWSSPYGVVDMSGNVWEWCLTDYDNPARDAEQEDIGANVRHVVRGGSWFHLARYARCASRFGCYPLDWYPSGLHGPGFRVVSCAPV